MRRAAVALCAVALGACGAGDGRTGGPLTWQAEPRVFTHPTLRGDTVLAGEVVNASLRPVRLRSADLRVVEADGDRLPSNGSFLPGYARALMPRNRAEPLPDYEQRRLGRVLELKPGERAPVNVAWRGRGAALAYGAGVLEIRRAR